MNICGFYEKGKVRCFGCVRLRTMLYLTLGYATLGEVRYFSIYFCSNYLLNVYRIWKERLKAKA